jgi:methyl-accepting chemotaxis protein
MKRFSLRTVALTFVVFIVLVGFGAAVTTLTWQAGNQQKEAAGQHARALAGQQAEMVQRRLSVALQSARSLGQALKGLKSAGKLDRDAANALIRSQLEAEPGLLALWTGWEPNSFDSRDKDFVGAPGHDDTGRYVPYWNRGSGQVSLEALTGYDKDGDGDYYLLPKRSGRETLVEPYVYKVGGKDVLMTSLSVPIVMDGKVVGISGVDIALADLQAEIGKLRPYSTGHAALVSHSGKYLASVDATQVGKSVADLPQAVADALRQGTSAEVTVDDSANGGARSLQRWVPVRVGASDTPWSFVMTVPEDQMLSGLKTLKLTSLLIGVGCLAAVSLALALMLDRLVLRPLGGEPAQAAAVARRVAQGDLCERVAAREGDGTSLMAALADMQAKLGSVVAQVRDNADGVATAATEIAQGNSDLSSRTEQQASALQETAASMEQLTSTIRQNADNAQRASDLAHRACGSAQESGNVVRQVVATMKDIQDSSQQIAAIVTTVDGIAFQTNLLAPNAAVEAARAGDQGRGFAVVANEVRMLSQRSAEAAREIKTLVATSVDRVEKGTSLVGQAGAAVEGLVESIQGVSTLVADISTASREQSQGVEQVSSALGQMDNVTQQNAALVEESAAAAISLQQQAATLVSTVAVFKV